MSNEESPALSGEFPTIPRKVVPRLGPLITAAFLLVCLLPFMTYATYFLAADALNTVLVQRRGVDAVAQVREMGQTTGRGAHCWARFAFEFGGNLYENTDVIERKDYTALHRGDAIPILVDPKNAKRSKANIDGTARNPDPIEYLTGLLTLSMVIFGCAILLVVIRAVRHYKRERRLLISGVAIKASITAKEEYQARTTRYLKISYSFLSPKGTHYGERNNLPIEIPEIVLDEPVVFYAPEAPDINAFYPMEWVKLAGEL